MFEQLPIWVSRTGYTGEDGFELVAPAEKIEALWKHILSVGNTYGLKPAGLGARDTLRLEAGFPLYGQELNETTTPLDAGLRVFVSFDKDEFVGRGPLLEQKEKGTKKRLVGFEMSEKSAPPRSHYAIWSTGEHPAKIGEVTSGTQSPSLGIGIGMGYVPPELAAVDTLLEIEIRNKRAPARVVKRPFYRKPD
jgi:aminomethyltransferase